MNQSLCQPTCPVKIVQGQSANLVVQLIDGSTGKPFNLAGLSGATGVFPDIDGESGLASSGTLISSDLGTLAFALDPTFTSELQIGEQMSIQVQVDQGSLRSIAVVENVLTVIAPPYTPVNFGS
jgi:hypothetical protein